MAERHRRMLHLAEEGGDEVDRLVRSLVSLIRKHYPDAGEHVQSEITLARQAARKGVADGSLHRLASLAEWLLFGASMPEVAAAICGLGANLANTLDEGPSMAGGRSNLLNVAGLVAMQTGRNVDAHRLFLASRDLAQQAADRDLEASTLLNLTNLERLADDYDAAAGLARSALDLYRASNNGRGQAQMLLTLGHIATERAQWDEAERWAKEAEPLIHARRDPELTSGYHHLRARAAAGRGDHDRAEALYKKSLAAAKRSGSPDRQITGLQNLAALSNERERHALARKRLRAALELAEQSGRTARVVDLLPVLIRSEFANGDRSGALAAATRFVAVATDVESDVAQAHALLGAALVDNDQVAEGIEELEVGWQLLEEEEAEDPDLRGQLVHNLIVAHSRLGDLSDHASLLADRAAELADSAAPAALEELGLATAQEQAAGNGFAERILLDSLARRPNRQRAWSSILIASQLERLQQPKVAESVLRVGYTASRRSRQHTLTKQVRNDLALALVEMNEFPEALRLLSQNLEAAEADGDDSNARLAHYNLSETFRRLDSPEEAEQSARKAVELATSSEDSLDLADSRLQLALTLMDQNSFVEAKQLLDAVVSSDAPAEVTSAALSSLGGLALGEGDYATAIRRYREALATGRESPRQRVETLLALSEALAADSNRRSYLAALQRAVDAIEDVRYDSKLASRFLRLSQAWLANDKPRFAGEALAVAVLVGGVQPRSSEDELLGPDGPFMAGLATAAVALYADWGFAGDTKVRAGLERELGQHLSKRLVKKVMRWIDDVGTD